MQALQPLILIAVFIAFFYFLAIRPQKRRQLEMQNLQKNLKAGDEIVMLSGIYGTVTEVEEGGTVLIEVSEDTEIRIAASAIGSVVPPHVAADTTSVESPATTE
jgi:preprotein translocase subunit YajC